MPMIPITIKAYRCEKCVHEKVVEEHSTEEVKCPKCERHARFVNDLWTGTSKYIHQC